MTQAFEVMASARNSSDGMHMAEEVAVNIDQDLVNESTIYTFRDQSVLVACGSQLNAYNGAVFPKYTVSADRVTGEWIDEVEFVDYVSRDEWHARLDTDDLHFDTYEEDGVTCAIEVIWA